jgi:hypothetical protein
MIRKRTFKEFDLGQVPLPDNQSSTEYNSQSITNSPAAIEAQGHWVSHFTPKSGHMQCSQF